MFTLPAYKTVTIKRRVELLEACDKYGDAGFIINIDLSNGNVSIRFNLLRSTIYIVPLNELVYYAGFLPPKGKVVDIYAKDRSNKGE